MKNWILGIALFFSVTASLADTYPKNPFIDVLNYIFRIELSDATDEIKCEVVIDVQYLGAGVDFLRLDLVKASAALQNKGMFVSRVISAGKTLDFTHENDVL